LPILCKNVTDVYRMNWQDFAFHDIYFVKNVSTAAYL